MFLMKQKNGSYIPAYESDYELSRKIAPGTEVKATKARNPMFHRKYFALLNLGFNNNDTKDSFDLYRMKIQMKAGFVIWTKDKEGKAFPLPESISFEKMNEERFNEVFNAVLNIISTELDLTKPEIESEIQGFY